MFWDHPLLRPSVTLVTEVLALIGYNKQWSIFTKKGQKNYSCRQSCAYNNLSFVSPPPNIFPLKWVILKRQSAVNIYDIVGWIYTKKKKKKLDYNCLKTA